MEKSTAEVLNELGISFTQKGNNYIMTCVSGSHVDKHPSMSMDIETGVFKCWGCNFKGNLHTLYKHMTGNKLDSGYHNTGYETYKYISKKKAKNLTESKPKGDIELVEGAECSVFDNPRVMQYLESIGVYDEETIYDLEIKYTKFARYKSKYTPEFDSEGKKIKGTAFVNRIIFPIYDSSENLVNIEGRSYVGDTPKVLYPRDALSNFVYNLDKCDPNMPLVVNEGLKNLLKIRNVYSNVISIFGSSFTLEKQKLLLDRGFTDLIMFLDHDEASFAMADKLDETWDYDFRVCVPDKYKDDASDLTLRAIKSKINNAEDYGQWLMNRMKKEFNSKLKEFW